MVIPANSLGDSDEESVVVKAERKNHKGGIVAKVSRIHYVQCT